MNPNCELAVLDTNICLDIFVFHDSASAFLMKTIQEKNIIAITREDCREEWLRVLEYSKLALDNSEKAQSRHDFDNFIHLVNPEKRDYRLLPICSDKDDQKFMELAYDSHASYLFTKDKALLKLARKSLNKGQFRILSPAQWNGIPHID